MKVPFCGVIVGAVTVRRGETPEDAIQRAQSALLDVMERHAKRYGRSDQGPNIGLEPDTDSDGNFRGE